MTRNLPFDPLTAAGTVFIGLAAALLLLGAYTIAASLGLAGGLVETVTDGRILGTLVFGLFTVTVAVLIGRARPSRRTRQH